MKLNRMPRFLVFLFVVMLLSSCTSFAEDVTPPPGYQPPPPPEATATPESLVYPPTMPNPARGEPIYFEKCAPCHGETGLGDGPSAADLPNPVAAIGSKDVAHQSTPADWYIMVARGNLERYMPPFSSLSVSQRWDVLAYVYSLSMTDDELAEGGSLFSENCAACHGVNGDGTGPDADTLSQIPGDFTNQAIMADESSLMLFEAITQGHDDMRAYGDELSETQRWVLADFVRALSFEMSLPTADIVAAEPTQDAADQSSDSSAPAEPGEDANPAAGAAPRQGSITVLVSHGMGADLPASLEITLYIYDGMNNPDTRVDQTSPEGMIIFDGIDFIEGLFYIASVEHEGVAFGSNFFQADAETTAAQLDIAIFDTTTATDAVSIDRLHVFIEFVEPDILQVVQLMLLTNNSPRVIIPEEGQEASLTFALPPEADNLWLPGDSALPLFETVDSVGVANIHPSGEPYELMFAFEMPYEDHKLDLALPINYDTGAVIVMAPEDGVKLKSVQLETGTARDLEGMAYQSFSGSSLMAGDILSLSISGWPKTNTGVATASEDSQSNLIIGLIVFGISLLGAGFYLWFKSNANPDLLDDSENEENLMDAIVALDDLYQSGELPEDAYQTRREQLKLRLGAIIGAEE